MIGDPRQQREVLGRERLDRSRKDAERAQEVFVSMFQKGDMPDEMPEYQLEGEQTLLDVLEAAGLIESRGQGRRLLKQNGIKMDGNVVTDPFMVPCNGVLQVGKRKFVRLIEG